ncbi:LOG family protein [Streptomyces sp. NPDC051366]|uniref:LOG family protein n=1 Tax=Streptomyces sp. NPDC051366 TaxID=3365652 RepID=UPI003795E5C3
MGGHRLNRDEPAYRAVALLAKRLAQEGFLVATGGGPGAMEAAHLGAAFVHCDASVLEDALVGLATAARLPDLTLPLFTPDGSVDPERKEVLEDAHQWLVAALDARALCPAPRGESLAIPTWRYGQEPTTPFATAYAKFFQNSIREEALVAKSKAGIIYAQGGGGTIREIFEDMEENYYAASSTDFTPMIFFDSHGYWNSNAEFNPVDGSLLSRAIKLDEVVNRTFKVARASHHDTEQCLEKVRFIVDVDEIVSLLHAHASTARANLALMLEGRSAELPAASWNR